MPARTVSRNLARHGIPRLAVLDPITGEVIRSSKSTAIRYEREKPGELVHMDVKKLGKIPDGGGWRVHGRADADKHRNAHSLVDDHSRPAYSATLDDEKGPTCASFLNRAIAYLATHGITRIERLITNNAWVYQYLLRKVCAANKIRQKIIKPQCPWQTGKVDRPNRTLATEWAYGRAFTSNQTRRDAHAPWREHYNTQRRH